MRRSSFYVLTSVSLAALMAVSAAGQARPSTAGVADVLRPKEQWKVGTVDTSGAPYCVMMGKFEGDSTLAFARSPEGFGSLGIEFREALFKKGEKYEVSLSLDHLAPRVFSGDASSGHSLVLQIGEDGALYDSLNRSDVLRIGTPAVEAHFSLVRFQQNYKNLLDCANALAAPAERVEIPVIAAADAGVAASGKGGLSLAPLRGLLQKIKSRPAAAETAAAAQGDVPVQAHEAASPVVYAEKDIVWNDSPEAAAAHNLQPELAAVTLPLPKPAPFRDAAVLVQVAGVSPAKEKTGVSPAKEKTGVSLSPEKETLAAGNAPERRLLASASMDGSVVVASAERAGSALMAEEENISQAARQERDMLRRQQEKTTSSASMTEAAARQAGIVAKSGPGKRQKETAALETTAPVSEGPAIAAAPVADVAVEQVAEAVSASPAYVKQALATGTAVQRTDLTDDLRHSAEGAAEGMQRVASQTPQQEQKQQVQAQQTPGVKDNMASGLAGDGKAKTSLSAASGEKELAAAQPVPVQAAAPRLAPVAERLVEIVRAVPPAPVMPAAKMAAIETAAGGNRAEAFLENIMQHHRPKGVPAPAAKPSSSAPAVSAPPSVPAAAAVSPPAPAKPASVPASTAVAPAAPVSRTPAPVLRNVPAPVSPQELRAVTLETLLEKSGVRGAVFEPLQYAGEDVSRQWSVGRMSGLYEQMPVGRASFEVLAHEYLDRYREDCPGQLDVKLGAGEYTPAGIVSSGTLSCRMQGNSYDTSVIFVQSRGHFGALLHSGNPSDAAQVRSVGDNIFYALSSSAGLSPLPSTGAPVSVHVPVSAPASAPIPAPAPAASAPERRMISSDASPQALPRFNITNVPADDEFETVVIE